MSEYYAGKIKVVGPRYGCFPVDPDTLEPLACSTYDPWAWSDPDRDALETITIGEWNRRTAERDERAREQRIKDERRHRLGLTRV